MNDLITRLTEGEGGDRELDALAMLHVGAATAINPKAAERVRLSPKIYPDEASELYYRAPDLTVSLDACIALAEKVLPGWGWRLLKFTGYHVIFHDVKEVERHSVHHKDLCRAFLIALLKSQGRQP